MIKKSSYVPLLTLFVGAGMLATVQLTTSDVDDRIELSVRQSDIFRHGLRNDDVQITSRNGVVRLTGTVIDAAYIDLAGETVARLPGVVEVRNQLTEQSGGAADNTDKWLVENVHSTLRLNRNVQADEITVSAFDGAVIIGGIARNATGKDLARTFTGDVRGFEMVNDTITLAYEGEAAQ